MHLLKLLMLTNKMLTSDQTNDQCKSFSLYLLCVRINQFKSDRWSKYR